MRHAGTRGYVLKVAVASASIHLSACEPKPSPPEAQQPVGMVAEPPRGPASSEPVATPPPPDNDLVGTVAPPPDARDAGTKPTHAPSKK